MDKQLEKTIPEEEAQEEVEEHNEGSEGEDDDGSDENPEKEKFSSPAAAKARFEKLPEKVRSQLSSTHPAVVFGAFLDDMNTRCRKTREDHVTLDSLLMQANQIILDAKKVLDTVSAAKLKDVEDFVNSTVKFATAVFTVDPMYPKYKEMWERYVRSLMYSFRHDVFPPPSNTDSPIKTTAPKELVDYIKSVHPLDCMQMLIDFVKLQGDEAKQKERKAITNMREIEGKFAEQGKQDPQSKKEYMNAQREAQRRVDVAQSERVRIFSACDKYVELRQRSEGTWTPKKKLAFKKRGPVTRPNFRPAQREQNFNPQREQNFHGQREQSNFHAQRDQPNFRPQREHTQNDAPRREPQQFASRGGRGGYSGDRNNQDRRPYKAGTYQMQPARQPSGPSNRGGFRSAPAQNQY